MQTAEDVVVAMVVELVVVTATGVVAAFVAGAFVPIASRVHAQSFAIRLVPESSNFSGSAHNRVFGKQA